ncbi:hypothetical protein SCYAM73S_02885 [Streptomyces cyaneofuscatus]
MLGGLRDEGHITLGGFEQPRFDSGQARLDVGLKSLVPHVQSERPDDGHEGISCLLTITLIVDVSLDPKSTSAYPVSCGSPWAASHHRRYVRDQLIRSGVSALSHTAADTEPDRPPPEDDHAFFGQPRGLMTLSGLEVWERFSFLGMQAILVLFFADKVANGGMGMDPGTAASVSAAYGTLVYLVLRGRRLAGRPDPSAPSWAVLYGGTSIACGQVRGIIGPWSHQYPDRGLPPGPAIGFLQETLRWWDQHLKGKETGVMREPLLRSWISGSHPPTTVYETLPGRWVGDASWPSENVSPVAYALQGGERIVASPQQTGLDAGRFFPFGNEADLPPDQRDEDAKSVSFEFPVEEAPIEILGRPRVKLRIRMDVPRGQAIARLCDVAPDGSSALVTRGVLNLAARHGRDRTDDWTPGDTEDVVFDLNGIGHTFPPGHRIRLAVSSSYWPWIWPQAGSAGFTLDADGSFVELPVRRHTEDPAITFGEPEQAEPLGVVHPVTLEEPRPERLVVRDVAKGEWRLEVDPRYGGTRVYPDGLEFTEDALETYTIQQDDPLSARTRSDWRIRLHRPEMSWDVEVETRSEIAADDNDFITSNEVICKDGGEVVFHRTWEKRIPRTAG